MADLSKYEQTIKDAADEWNLDPVLLKSVIHQESGGDPGAVSPKGARGLTGLMPDTAKGLGVTDINDPAQQIYGGAKYLSEGLDKEKTPDDALRYYHGGPRWRDKVGPESDGYAPAVTGHYQRYTALNAATAQDGQTKDTIGPWLKERGQNLDAKKYNWCAAFVNGSLAEAGVQGSGSDVANSFLRWGQPVKGEPNPGDVMVKPNDRGPDELKGHVGIATGRTQGTGAQTKYEMIQGNYGGKVTTTWESPREIVVRRNSDPAPTQAAPVAPSTAPPAVAAVPPSPTLPPAPGFDAQGQPLPAGWMNPPATTSRSASRGGN